jgi:cell division protein FtsZ
MEYQADHNVEDHSPVFSLPEGKPYGNPVIRIIGVGGGGSNAVNRMFSDRVSGVEYFAINTDAQHLALLDVPNKLAIGQSLTRGLGAGGNPDIGRQAAEESRDKLEHLTHGADMVFLACGMGGGTGTGALPVVAQIAKESGALTVAVVSRPFSFEVRTRRKNADEGLLRLQDHVDTVITIPNDKLLDMERQRENQTVSWDDALRLADSVLQHGIQAIAEVVMVTGEINVDFADVRAIMLNAGPAWLAIGHGTGENRALDAARMATKSPLLDIAIEGAKRILFVMTGGPSLSLREIQQASSVIEELADSEANVIFGTVKDPKLTDEVKITLVAASFPMPEENMVQRQEELRNLLRQSVSQTGDDLDVPSFLRKETVSRNRGFFG